MERSNILPKSSDLAELVRRFKRDPNRAYFFAKMQEIVNLVPSRTFIITATNEMFVSEELPEPYNAPFQQIKEALKTYELTYYPELFESNNPR